MSRPTIVHTTRIIFILPQINDWLQFAVYAKPEIANITDIGLSYEGRKMKVLKVCLPTPGGATLTIRQLIDIR